MERNITTITIGEGIKTKIKVYSDLKSAFGFLLPLSYAGKIIFSERVMEFVFEPSWLLQTIPYKVMVVVVKKIEELNKECGLSVDTSKKD